MAARRTQVGLRRRRSGLSGLSAPTGARTLSAEPPRADPPPRGPKSWDARVGASRAARAFLVVALTWAALPGCVGLSDEETNVLTVHLQNSTLFFQQASYRQALHQANMALVLDEHHMGMRIIKGFCLTKLGATQGTEAELDQALEIFDDLKPGRGGKDYRTWLGSGEAHMARALKHQQALERIERRLKSDFLTEEGRESELEKAADEAEGKSEQLLLAEEDLRKVLDFPLHHDNTYALLDLIVTVNMAGDRPDESVALCRRAIDLLVEGIQLTRETLNDGIRLSPSKKVDLQQRVDESLGKERQLRQILVSIDFARGSYQRCLDEIGSLEERQLITASDHLLRADIFEKLGMLPDALDELDVFLRMRSRLTDYDGVASETLRRIDALRAKIAASS